MDEYGPVRERVKAGVQVQQNGQGKYLVYAVK